MEHIKGIGDISGVAMRFLFLDPIQKALDAEEIYGIGLARRLKIIQAYLFLITKVLI